MPGSKTVNLDDHAISTLRYIRASMDAAASVAIPGIAGIVMGVIGLAATALSMLPSLEPYWFVIWLATAPVAAGGGGFLLTRSTSIASFTATGTPGRKLALTLLPSLIAGAVMTILLRSVGHYEAIAGTWLLLYGCALTSASVVTMSIVAWMGLCFGLLGVTALLAPAALHVPLLGVGFGGLHILFGMLIHRGRHGR